MLYKLYLEDIQTVFVCVTQKRDVELCISRINSSLVIPIMNTVRSNSYQCRLSQLSVVSLMDCGIHKTHNYTTGFFTCCCQHIQVSLIQHKMESPKKNSVQLRPKQSSNSFYFVHNFFVCVTQERDVELFIGQMHFLVCCQECKIRLSCHTKRYWLCNRGVQYFPLDQQ